tara:strand:- start:469 stop:1002 length:534 start_codon:yes stop_codon:yes gene_type:complete
MSQIQVDTITESTNGSGVSIPGHITQVIGITDNTDTSYNISSATQLGNLSIAITPKATSSKILLIASLNLGTYDERYWNVGFFRGSTALGVSDQGTGSQTNAAFTANTGEWTGSRYHTMVTHIHHLDSPSTTSATTYSVKVSRYTSSNIYYNRPQYGTDAGYDNRTQSNFTVMEVGG